MLRDPDRYVYAPIQERPRIVWPGEANLAVWVVVNHEVYEFDPIVRPPRKPWPRVHPDILEYSHRDYGNRVGCRRVLEALDRCGFRGSLNVNVAAIDHFPAFTAECVERGWEVFSHGVYNSRFVFGLSEAEERLVIEDCIAKIERQAGYRPAGWMGPMGTMTERTLDLLAEYGFAYTVELFHEDQPLPVKVRSGRLISIPYTQEVNDIVVFGTHHQTPAQYAQRIRDQFDCLYAEGAQSGRVMCVALHPYLIGQPHRIRHLEEALAYIASHDRVWLTTGREIAEAYYKNHYETIAAAIGHPGR
jgi:peptidoglycan/xylan/chitin deacetylase (PgdA/CDA1 family)